MITIEDFDKIDLCVGTIVRREAFLQAKAALNKPWIYLKELRIKKLNTLYNPENLVDRQMIRVVNFLSKQVGNFIYEGLTAYFLQNSNRVFLCNTAKKERTERAYF